MNDAETPYREPWQILDVGSIWMKEFAAALAGAVPVVAWEPVMHRAGLFRRAEHEELLREPALAIRRYPLQRGYARAPLRQLVPFEHGVLRRLRGRCKRPERSPLILSTPFYAPVAERWPGPSVYYVTDLTARYAGLDAKQVAALDTRMCRAVRAVCPNSARIAAYLREDGGCDPGKITIVPNATRASNLPERPLLQPEPLPADIAHLRRPLAGVIGNLAANMDWEFLEGALAATPGLTWVFVGPTSMPVPEGAQARARAAVMRRAFFTGAKPYSELQSYARCFDVAVLPYRRREPTFSGSSTRFYEHLPACRPMLATRGFAELLEKPPLLELVDTAGELAAAVERLQAVGFRDGLEAARWEAARDGTWEGRARAVREALENRL